ncbi:hypothetical protein LguiB_009061 [Lonicera macranthoides]
MMVINGNLFIASHRGCDKLVSEERSLVSLVGVNKLKEQVEANQATVEANMQRIDARNDELSVRQDVLEGKLESMQSSMNALHATFNLQFGWIKQKLDPGGDPSTNNLTTTEDRNKGILGKPAGLQGELRNFVQMMKPATLDEAVALARLQEVDSSVEVIDETVQETGPQAEALGISLQALNGCATYQTPTRA